MFKPIATEKAVKMIEKENILTLEFERERRKEDIKKEIEETFKVKVKKMRTLIRNNKKICYIKLDKKNPAIDIATKLGVM
ncbi:MAG: 50S ribosomal protein L23 [Candidatus Pacearchaeota archaeon]